jgi:hypothetical protein
MTIGLGALLFVLFVALKLTHQIAWSWLWVSCPLWAGIALWAAIIATVGVFGAACVALSKWGRR